MWELHARYGTLITSGDLYTVATAWTRMRRAGRPTVRYGEPAIINGRRTVECTQCHDCQCRACNRIPAPGQPDAARDQIEPAIAKLRGP